VNEAFVRLEGVRKSFGDLIAVRSLDLAIPQGGFFSIIGPSGCGKTTTLRLIAGLEYPDTGRIYVADDDVTRIPAYRRPVNTVFQSYALFPHLDVAANVAFGLVEERRPKEEIRRRAADMLRLVQLAGREQSRPRQLSGGQQQRVALARALVKQPQVLLLDEPLGALDLKLRKELQGQLKDIQRRVGITFIYVTHDQEEAFSMSDRVAVMDHGVLEQVGTPEEVYRHPATLFVATFVGEANRLPGKVSAADSGRYRVAVDGGPEVAADGPAGLATGQAVTMIVRPEHVKIVGRDGQDDDSDTRMPARVTDASFLGPVRHVRLESERLGTLVVTQHGEAASAPLDAQVKVSFDDGAAWLVALPAQAGVIRGSLSVVPGNAKRPRVGEHA
jgi:spermidine/putrescine transport system ATP-binding protein